MSARIVSFGSGARWFVEGWRLFRVSPGLWLVLVIAYWLILVLVNLLPIIGFAAWILHPAFLVGFMALSRNCEQRGKLGVGLLFEGFRGRPIPQLVLGCAYVALLAVLVGATSLADGGALSRWVLTGRRPEEEQLHSAELFGALLLSGALYVPITMLFWFAPVLAAWHAMGPAQALFYSFFATLLNWRAFLAYFCVAAAILVVIPIVLLGALVLASGRPGVNVAPLIFGLLVFLQPTLFASFYASYRDVFRTDDSA